MAAESEKIIEHTGTIVGKDGDTLKVEILNNSACGACSAASLCSAVEMKKKVVDVDASASKKEYRVGDVIAFVGEEGMGVRAVLVAYVAPLLLMVAGLLLARWAGCGDAGCAAAALAPLVPFYLTLWLFRGKIDRTFKFRTKNQ